MKQAFVTLLSTADYLEAVLVLNKGLRRVNAKYPLLVVVTKTIANDFLLNILKQQNILYEIVEPLYYHSDMQNKWRQSDHKAVLNTASKLQIFTLKQWDKLVYIDSDVLILQNIDELFDYPDGSMLVYEGYPLGFTGLMVVEPKWHQASDIYPIVIKHLGCADGDLLGKLWFHVRTSVAHQIPEIYCWPYRLTDIPDYIKVIHFGETKKPWLHESEWFYDSQYQGARLYKEILAQVRQELTF